MTLHISPSRAKRLCIASFFGVIALYNLPKVVRVVWTTWRENLSLKAIPNATWIRVGVVPALSGGISIYLLLVRSSEERRLQQARITRLGQGHALTAGEWGHPLWNHLSLAEFVELARDTHGNICLESAVTAPPIKKRAYLRAAIATLNPQGIVVTLNRSSLALCESLCNLGSERIASQISRCEAHPQRAYARVHVRNCGPTEEQRAVAYQRLMRIVHDLRDAGRSVGDEMVRYYYFYLSFLTSDEHQVCNLRHLALKRGLVPDCAGWGLLCDLNEWRSFNQLPTSLLVSLLRFSREASHYEYSSQIGRILWQRPDISNHWDDLMRIGNGWSRSGFDQFLQIPDDPSVNSYVEYLSPKSATWFLGRCYDRHDKIFFGIQEKSCKSRRKRIQLLRYGIAKRLIKPHDGWKRAFKRDPNLAQELGITHLYRFADLKKAFELPYDQCTSKLQALPLYPLEG